jgi:hypothetical protein
MLVGFVLLVGAGCGREKSLAAQQCPTGEYYDIRSGQCGEARDAEDRYRFGYYAELEELSRDDRASLQAIVSPATWLAEKEFVRLSSAPSVLGIRKVVVHLPEVGGGTILPLPLPPGTTATTALDAAFSEAESRFGQMSTNDAAEPLGTLLPSIRSSKDFDIGVFWVEFASPQEAISWWQSHAAEIRLVQPVTSDVDESAPIFEPGEVIE